MKFYSAPKLSAFTPAKERMLLSANIGNIPVLKTAVAARVYLMASAKEAFN